MLLDEKTSLKWLFTDICCLVICCFDGKTVVFRHKVLGVYYILLAIAS